MNKMLEEAAQPQKHLFARDVIREALGSCSEHISDATIFHILILCGGRIERALRKCLLVIQAEAMKTNNGPVKLHVRELLRKHEAGLLLGQVTVKEIIIK